MKIWGADPAFYFFLFFCRNVDAKSYTKVVRKNPEDNYIWRKYGQKEIQGLKHPR